MVLVYDLLILPFLIYFIIFLTHIYQSSSIVIFSFIHFWINFLYTIISPTIVNFHLYFTTYSSNFSYLLNIFVSQKQKIYFEIENDLSIHLFSSLLCSFCFVVATFIEKFHVDLLKTFYKKLKSQKFNFIYSYFSLLKLFLKICSYSFVEHTSLDSFVSL